MIVLAALDLGGAVLARRWIEQRSAIAMVLGCLTFAALFVVYARGLGYAELSTITFGWVVMLQIGVVVLEHAERGHGVPADKLVVMGALLALQGYLLMGSGPAAA